jgi:putative FmdB family regulatory protein
VPLYEYECSSCRRRFELRQKVTDEPVRVCPTCGGECRKVFHPVGIVFKGSGWYVTDSRKSETVSSTDKSDGDKPADGAAAKPAADGAKSETKPASNGETSSSAKSDKTPVA